MTRRSGWLWPASLGVLVAIIGLVRVVSAGSRLTGDRAVLALQVADIARGNSEAVGLYSWHDWSHPGAALFYLLVPFHWLAGGNGWGIFAGVAALSGGCVAVTAWLAFRRRGIVAASLAVGVMLLVWAATGRMTPVDPWTPYVGVTIFVVFMTAVWGAAERDRAAVWVMILSGALLVQIHVGYVPLVGAIGITALASYWWTGGNPRAVVRPLATSLLMFLPWLTDVRGVARNLADIVRYFRSSPDATVGFGRAVEVMSHEFGPRASWLRGPQETGIIGEAPSASAGWLIAALLALVAATVVVHRATHTPENELGVLRRNRILFERLWVLAPTIWVTVVVALVSTARVKGFLFPYVVAWRPVVVLIVLGWIGATAVAAVAIPRRPLMAIGVVGMIAASAMALAPLGRYDTVTDDDATVHGAIEQATRFLAENESADFPALVRLRLGDAGLVGLFPATLWELEQSDVPVGVDADMEWIVGERVVPSGEETTVWMICDTGFGWSLLAASPGAQIVSVVSPFTADTEVRVRELQTLIAGRLRDAGRLQALTTLDSPLVALALADDIAAGIVDGDAVEELAAFNILTPEPGRRFGIVAFDPDAVPEIWWPLEPF